MIDWLLAPQIVAFIDPIPSHPSTYIAFEHLRLYFNFKSILWWWSVAVCWTVWYLRWFILVKVTFKYMHRGNLWQILNVKKRTTPFLSSQLQKVKVSENKISQKIFNFVKSSFQSVPLKQRVLNGSRNALEIFHKNIINKRWRLFQTWDELSL